MHQVAYSLFLNRTVALKLFNIVNHQTRKRVESPFTQSIRLGAIVGLASHTPLIAKDGWIG